jgi:ribosome biogenesis GTPase A
VREPYSAVGYLAQRIPLPQLLNIQHPEDPDKNGKVEWSAFDICEAWAEKRGFLTARAARPDVYRAANNLLRLALEGRLCMCTRPPNYTAQKGVLSTSCMINA